RRRATPRPRRRRTSRRSRPAGRAGWRADAPPSRGGIGRGARLSHALLFLREIIDEQVLPEPVGARVERPPLVDAGHAFDEGAEARAVVEHEGVDDDPAAGDALDLLERLLRGPHADAPERQRPFAV